MAALAAMALQVCASQYVADAASQPDSDRKTGSSDLDDVKWLRSIRDMRPFKILLVGTGSIGIRHLNNLSELGQKDFVVFRSQRTGSDSRFGDIPVRTHFELESALKEKPEIAVIANPTSLHIPVAQAAAEQGCHLFLEKPISNDLNGVEQLRSEVEKRRLVAGVGYNLRFHPALQLLREKLRENVVGDVLSVRAWMGQYLPDWHPDRRLPTKLYGAGRAGRRSNFDAQP